MMRRFFGGVRAAMSSAFGWCNDRDEDEVQNVERASAEILSRFRATFIDNYRLVSGGRQVGVELTAESFPRMCVNSRE